MTDHALTGLHVLSRTDDPRWRTAPASGGGEDLRFVPYAPPFASPPSARIDWFREDGELVLLEDGYPAKLIDTGLLVHPMHGRYLLEDLLVRHGQVRALGLGDEIARIAWAIVGRSEARGGVRRIWYKGAAASGLAVSPQHVSGLPQAYYASLLTRASVAVGDPGLADAADAFFAVLTTSVEADGARYDGPVGPSLAMVPMEPRDWILNGVLSMLVAVATYASERPSAVARAVVRDNLDTLLRVLPAFDVPRLRLSRYMLPGVLQLAIDIERPAEASIHDLVVAVPGEGRFPVPRREATGWRNRLRPSDVAEPDEAGFMRLVGVTARFVAVVSRAPEPEPNTIELEIDSTNATRIRLRAHLGSYDPIGSRMTDRAWRDLAEARVSAGRSRVSLAIPYEPIELVGYPTSFARTFGGRRLNVYHATHVVRLRQLAALTGVQELAAWATRWRGYIDDWASMPAYQGFGAWSPEGDL